MRRSLDFVHFSEKVEKLKNYHDDPVLHLIKACDEYSKKARIEVENSGIVKRLEINVSCQIVNYQLKDYRVVQEILRTVDSKN